jgi:hypothetical protein
MLVTLRRFDVALLFGKMYVIPCRGGEMADAADLKSSARKGVRVRIPPSAPACGYHLNSGLAATFQSAEMRVLF